MEVEESDGPGVLVWPAGFGDRRVHQAQAGPSRGGVFRHRAGDRSDGESDGMCWEGKLLVFSFQRRNDPAEGHLVPMSESAGSAGSPRCGSEEFRAFISLLVGILDEASTLLLCCRGRIVRPSRIALGRRLL